METHNLKKQQIKRFLARPYSWSCHSAFRDYDRELWFKRYILGEKTPQTKELDFGKIVGSRLELDPTYIPEVPREKVMEYELTAKMGKVQLIGYADSYGEDTKTLREYKTGKAEWNQERVDEHGQITLYMLMLMLRDGITPEEITCTLHWLPTENKGDFSLGFRKPFKVHHFTTKRTTKQVLMFGAEIIRLRKEMLKYIQEHE